MTRTSAQRYNERMDKMFEDAKRLKEKYSGYSCKKCSGSMVKMSKIFGDNDNVIGFYCQCDICGKMEKIPIMGRL
jgi:hypothetical protein